MIDFREIEGGEGWELFARDFLVELGFYIESAPDRGADAGKDIIASEELAGKVGNYRLNWLVSCKHFAVSEKAVSEADEQNLLERIDSFNADGFIGFYSTVPTAGLNNRLRTLRGAGKIKDYRIFDQKLVESYLLNLGFSTLLLRYLPESYKRIRPLNALFAEYQPIPCAACGIDLLEELYRGKQSVFVYLKPIANEQYRHVAGTYCACKGNCDRLLEDKYYDRGLMTTWQDITDLATPVGFMQFVFGLLNDIRRERMIFSDEAFNEVKDFLYRVAQKVLRETTPQERKRIADLLVLADAGL